MGLIPDESSVVMGFFTDTVTDAKTADATAAELGVRPARPGDDTDLRRFRMELAWEQSRLDDGDYKRALVYLPDGGKYRARRPSSYGSPMEYTGLLEAWKLRELSKAIATIPAYRLATTRLMVRAADPNEEIARKAKKDWNRSNEEAMKAAGSQDAASIGTSLHDILELDDLGRDTGYVPEEWQADLAAYRRLRRCFETLSSELIVVNDKYRAGGKYDRAIRLQWPMEATRADGTKEVVPAGAVLIGDVKTSQTLDFAGCKFGEQCWFYANSVPYDPTARQRYDWPHEPPRTDWAVILHVPSGKGLASTHWVDLIHYGQAVADTARVYDWRNSKGKRGIRPGQAFEDYALTAARAGSVGELRAAYERAVAAGEWTDEVKARFSARRMELEVSA